MTTFRLVIDGVDVDLTGKREIELIYPNNNRELVKKCDRCGEWRDGDEIVDLDEDKQVCVTEDKL